METCERCGEPEPSKYKCDPGRTFTCSRCIQETTGDELDERQQDIDQLQRKNID